MTARTFLCCVAAAIASLAACGAPALAVEPPMRVAWGAANNDAPGDSKPDATYRAIVRPTLSGPRLRVRLSNALSAAPLEFSSAAVGLRAPQMIDGRTRGAGVVAGTSRRLLFAGEPTITIPPGETRYSDTVSLDVRAQRDLAVSLHAKSAQPITAHSDALTSGSSDPTLTQSPTQYVTAAGAGDRTQEESAGAFSARGTDTYWVDAVDVSSRSPGAVVAVGDSITEGSSASASGASGARADAYDRWPDVLGRRLGELAVEETASSINEGVAGDNIPRVEARLERDVLSQSGVTQVILLIGTNDFTGGRNSTEVIAGIRRIADRLRARGIKVIGGTILPREPFSTALINIYRHQVNDFIRTSDLFAGVADFDQIVRDPDDPERMRPEFTDEADGLHPNSRGYEAMGRGIDLDLLRTPRPVPELSSADPASTAPDTAPAPAPATPRPSPATIAPSRRPRVRAAFMTVRVRSRRAGRRLHLSTSGRLGVPAEARSDGACREGVIAVQVKARRRTISARLTRVRDDCTFRSAVTFGGQRRLRGGPVIVEARFAGNASLLPRRATARLRIPR